MFEKYFPIIIATKGMIVEFDKNNDRRIYCHLEAGCGHDLLATLIKEAVKIQGTSGELEIEMEEFEVYFKLW